MAFLQPGTPAPEFTASDQDGNKISLSDFRGSKVILYFYPKDNTPGCTAEACNFRDNYSSLTEKGFVVLGVSADSEKSHQRFASAKQLPFVLLADTSKDIINAYHAWGPKKFMGRSFEGILRCTYIIGEDGKIEHVIDKVKTKQAAQQVLDLYTDKNNN